MDFIVMLNIQQIQFQHKSLTIFLPYIFFIKDSSSLSKEINYRFQIHYLKINKNKQISASFKSSN